MALWQALTTVETAADQKDLLLALRRYANAKCAGPLDNCSIHLLVALSSGGPSDFLIRLDFYRPCYSHSDYKKMNYIHLTSVQSPR